MRFRERNLNQFFKNGKENWGNASGLMESMFRELITIVTAALDVPLLHFNWTPYILGHLEVSWTILEYHIALCVRVFQDYRLDLIDLVVQFVGMTFRIYALVHEIAKLQKKSDNDHVALI
jgi:hypothetical protein